MEQLDYSDGDGHWCNTNINHFALLFESDDEESTKHRMKPRNPIIALSEYEEEDKIKGRKTRIMKMLKMTGKEENSEDRQPW